MNNEEQNIKTIYPNNYEDTTFINLKKSKKFGLISIILGLLPILLFTYCIIYSHGEGENGRGAIIWYFFIYCWTVGIPVFITSIIFSIKAINKSKNTISLLSIIISLFPVIGIVLLFLISFFQSSFIKLNNYIKNNKNNYPFEFANVEFYNIQPSEGKLIFRSNGYLYTSNEGESNEIKYTYDKETNLIKTNNHEIKILYYDKDDIYLYCYYDKKPTIIKSSNTGPIEDLFINSNENINLVEDIKVDNYLIKKDGSVTNSSNLSTNYTYEGSKACLKNTSLCNFFKITINNNYSNIYEIQDNKFIHIKD